MRLVRGPFRRKPYVRTGASPAVQQFIGCRWYVQLPGLFVLFGRPAWVRRTTEGGN